MSTKNRFAEIFGLMLESELDTGLADSIEGGLDGAPHQNNELEDAAFRDSLDDDTSAEDYLIDPETDRKLQQQIDRRNQEIASVIEAWASRIDEFVEFLNGTGEDSLQSILAKAQPGTLFAKVQTANSRKLANSAQELASLSQSLKSFVGQKAISQ